MHVLAPDEDRLPLISSTSRTQSPCPTRSAARRSLRFKAVAILSLSLGMCLYFLAATKLLLRTSVANKAVDAVLIKMAAAFKLPSAIEPIVESQPIAESAVQLNDTNSPTVVAQPPASSEPTLQPTVDPELPTTSQLTETIPLAVTTEVPASIAPTIEPTATPMTSQPSDVVELTAVTESPASNEPIESTKEVEVLSPEPILQPLNPQIDGNYSDFACVGWRQTGGCSPDGPREPEKDEPCDAHIISGLSGYCEVQHRITGERRRVLPMHCDSTYYGKSFACESFVHLLEYGRNAVKYTHDGVFSFTNNQDKLLQMNGLSAAPELPQKTDVPTVATVDSFFRKGIVMVVYEKLLLGAYVSVRHLREMGSTLPVEMWYRPGETDPNHPLLKLLVDNHNVYLRELDHPLATGFYTKLHAVFYSAFDNVLLLDADNYAVRDPSYLFHSPEFTSTGAMFWPDFWKPDHTLFNVHNQSLVWQVFDLPYVDMFEQESGQVLIDRRRHMKALNVLMYYGFVLPHIHEEMRLVWGDKDLFRFAWMKTGSPFHMIARPPGSAGKLNTETNEFCGLTMVQHDAQGEIIFLHRNSEKLLFSNLRFIWTHVQQFKRESPITEYRIGFSQIFAEFASCFGQTFDWETLYDFTPMSELPFGGIETTLLRLANEAMVAINVTAPPPAISLEEFLAMAGSSSG